MSRAVECGSRTDEECQRGVEICSEGVSLPSRLVPSSMSNAITMFAIETKQFEPYANSCTVSDLT